MQTMFSATHEILSDRSHKYGITRNALPITYADALSLWQHDQSLLSCFDAILANSPFSAFRWETPPITRETADRHFEFVLLDSPGLARTPDTKTYANYFTADGADEGVMTFENLGKDALLVVPSPRGPDSAYGHLAAFVRGAPELQKIAFWRVVGRTVQQNLTDRPLWISTAGGGVAWLHVRLDSYPKYYGHGAYRKNA